MGGLGEGRWKKQGGRAESRQTGTCGFLPANPEASQKTERRRGGEEVSWGGGENQGICREGLSVEERESGRKEQSPGSACVLALCVCCVCSYVSLFPPPFPRLQGYWARIWGNVLGQCGTVGSKNGRDAPRSQGGGQNLHKHPFAGGRRGSFLLCQRPFSSCPRCLKCQAPVGSEQALGAFLIPAWPSPAPCAACPGSPRPSVSPRLPLGLQQLLKCHPPAGGEQAGGHHRLFLPMSLPSWLSALFTFPISLPLPQAPLKASGLLRTSRCVFSPGLPPLFLPHGYPLQSASFCNGPVKCQGPAGGEG